MILGILGKKIGMTQFFEEDGDKCPVTILEVGPCSVQVVKVSGKDGYNAVQMGYYDIKEKRLKKPQREEIKSRKLKPKRFVREMKYTDTIDLKVGDEITNGIFQKGDFVDITGISKGKGFQGGVKRHGWYGGKTDSHGNMSHRAPGSIGASSFPSRVLKGMGMAGHMGHARSTAQNLKIVEVNTENNTIAVKGAVPGANGAYVVVKYAKKKPLTPRQKADSGEGDGKKEESKE